MKSKQNLAELSVLSYAEDPPNEAYDTFGFFDEESIKPWLRRKWVIALQRFAERPHG
jgi:hypothetical protein